MKIARKTFRYTADGPKGLLTGKRAIIIQSSGDVYSRGPLKELEHGSRYLKKLLNFLGIESVDVVLMEGMDMTGTNTDEQRRRAIKQVEAMARRTSQRQ